MTNLTNSHEDENRSIGARERCSFKRDIETIYTTWIWFFFRYSREVGSTQINLPDLPAAIEVNQASGGSTRISDFSKRYHPDPTWRPTQPVRKPLTSSSSSASSTSSSASSTQSRDPEPILQASGSGSKRRRHFRTSKMASSANFLLF